MGGMSFARLADIGKHAAQFVSQAWQASRCVSAMNMKGMPSATPTDLPLEVAA
jgi:hypothetical protein